MAGRASPPGGSRALGSAAGAALAAACARLPAAGGGERPELPVLRQLLFALAPNLNLAYRRTRRCEGNGDVKQNVTLPW